MGSPKTVVRFWILGVSLWLVSILATLKGWYIRGGGDLSLLGDDVSFDLLTQIRIPRLILASSVGAGLSVSGAALQALFSNPLCEPYTLGISSGAALGAVVGGSIGFGLHWAGMTGSALLGALLFTFVLLFFSFRKKMQGSGLLLAGVMLGFLGSSLLALWMGINEAEKVQGVLLWLLGDLSRARLEGSLFVFISVSLISFLILFRWRFLDALLLGEESARSLGLNLDQRRRSLLVWVSLLVGICVSSAGMIGFVGLVIPHFVRKYAGPLHLRMLPLCALWGAVLVCYSDFLSRFIAAPYELPVGSITALLGAPVFLALLNKRVRV
jgi:iron complex transport system permease protein